MRPGFIFLISLVSCVAPIIAHAEAVEATKSIGVPSSSLASSEPSKAQTISLLQNSIDQQQADGSALTGPSTKTDWEALRKQQESKFRKGEIMFYSEEAMKHFGFEANCQGFEDAIKNCSTFHCIDKVNLFGTDVYVDKMVHGHNDNNECVITSGAARYMISNNELKNFAEIFLAPTSNSEAHIRVEHGVSITTNEFDQTFQGVTCHVKEENRADIGSNPALPGGKNNTSQASTKKTITVSPQNSAACAGAKFEFLDKLLDQGKIIPLEPTLIGFDPSNALVVPTGTSQKSETPLQQQTLKLTINGKTEESFKLGDKYEIQISGAPAHAKLVGKCSGAPNCSDWFLGNLKVLEADAEGNFKIPEPLPSNWNIPYMRYILWVETEDAQNASNRVNLTLSAKNP